MAEPLATAKGLVVWGVEATDGPRAGARVYLDAPAGEDGAGADIESCEEISRQLGAALDVEDVFAGPWTLEVSTPGLERKFFSLEQTRPFTGDMIEVSLKEPLPGENRKVYRGKLAEVGDDFLVVEPYVFSGEGEARPENLPPARLPWDLVRRASRVHLFKVPQKPGKGRSKKS